MAWQSAADIWAEVQTQGKASRKSVAVLKRVIAALALVLMLVGVVAAGPFEDGRAAYDRGDYVEAVRLFRPLAENGVTQAQLNLAVMYRTGRGLPQDDSEAITWFQRAAQQGHAIAKRALGSMYAEAQGVPRDYVAAHMWLSLAAQQGAQGAGLQRDIVARAMSPEQIAEAERLAREWTPTPEPLDPIAVGNTTILPEILSKADATATLAMSRDEWADNVSEAVAAGSARMLGSSESGLGITLTVPEGLLIITPIYEIDNRPSSIQVTVGYQPPFADTLTDLELDEAIKEAKRQMEPEFEVIGFHERFPDSVTVVMFITEANGGGGGEQ